MAQVKIEIEGRSRHGDTLIEPARVEFVADTLSAYEGIDDLMELYEKLLVAMLEDVRRWRSGKPPTRMIDG